MSKHTPGKWEVDNLTVISDDGEDVCNCDVNSYGIGEKIGNARLIAAAPELLESLKAMIDAQPFFKEDRDEQDDIALKMAQQAIAKAEGK